MTTVKIRNILTDIAPEFDSFDQALLDRFIGYARTRVAFGDTDTKNLATAYMAAHMLTMKQRDSKSGVTSSLKEGGLSIGYSTPSEIGGLKSTSYGMEYERLKRENVLSVNVTRNGQK